MDKKSVKAAELETLMAIDETGGDDWPDGTFFARTWPRDHWDEPWMTGIDKVVLVHRLREVTALVGFTRFEPLAPDAEGELDIDVRRADLARELNWVPAHENKGEGVFLQFSKEAIEGWVKPPAVTKRLMELKAGFDKWKGEHTSSNRDFRAAYVLLHSFAHLLITGVALCAARIGYGALIYTGSSDAEGTLGGLVEVGRRIADVVRGALELGKMCSNDPVCSQHVLANANEARYLQGAACHGCVLISETSCAGAGTSGEQLSFASE